VNLDCSGDVIEVSNTTALHPGQTVSLAIRPEKLEVLPAGSEPTGLNRLRTEVLTSSYVGSHYEYDVKLGNQVVQVESSRPGLSAQVCLVFEPAHALVYPEAVELSEEERDLLTVA
jgi:iron(III) transport system ATP-binding protein